MLQLRKLKCVHWNSSFVILNLSQLILISFIPVSFQLVVTILAFSTLVNYYFEVFALKLVLYRSKKELVVNIFSGWHSIKGRFISVIGANISCACAKSPEGLSPSAHLADGCLDLILVKHTSRLQYLRHMIRLSSKADQVRNQILLTVPRTF